MTDAQQSARESGVPPTVQQAQQVAEHFAMIFGRLASVSDGDRKQRYLSVAEDCRKAIASYGWFSDFTFSDTRVPREGSAPAPDTRRLDLVSEFLDGVKFEHDEDGDPRPVLDWFVGDGGGHWQTSGATWREAIDQALIRWYGDTPPIVAAPDWRTDPKVGDARLAVSVAFAKGAVPGMSAVDFAQGVHDALDALCDAVASRSAGTEAPPAARTCRWIEDEDGQFHTQCDKLWHFTTDGIKENGAKFCPYCGGPIIEFRAASASLPEEPAK